MSEHEEALIVCVGGMGLDGACILFERYPRVSVLERCLHEDAVLLRWEVCAANYLTDEVDFRFEVSPHTSVISLFLWEAEVLAHLLQHIIVRLGHF